MADDHRSLRVAQHVGRRQPGAGERRVERLHAGHRRAERIFAPGRERSAEALACLVPVEALERPVVHLDQAIVDPDPEPGRRGDRRRRVPGPRQRTRHDRVDVAPRQQRTGRDRLLAADRGQGDVGLAGVDHSRRTLGLPVADDVQAPVRRCRWGGHGWGHCGECCVAARRPSAPAVIDGPTASRIAAARRARRTGERAAVAVAAGDPPAGAGGARGWTASASAHLVGTPT